VSDEPSVQPAEEVGKYAKYQHLRANVRRRRRAYAWFIVLAILVFLASIADILFLRDEDWNADKVTLGGFTWGLIETVVYALYAVLFVWGLFLLLSRRRHKEDLAALAELERSLWACPDCGAIMELGLALPGEKTVAMSCPNCGRFNRVRPDAPTMHAETPAGRPLETRFTCTECNEEIGVGMFGRAPGPVQFRACPHCGTTGTVQPLGAPA
jgi:transcription elongation factor Elf1